MLRMAFVGFGRLMLLGSLVSGGFAIHALSLSRAGNTLAVARVHDEWMCSALAAAGWVACLFATGMLGVIDRLGNRSGDPYEAHPKMSPSVQPSYVAYGRAQSN